MKLIESKDCQPPIVTAGEMRPGQTGIVVSSEVPFVPVGSLVLRLEQSTLFNFDRLARHILDGRLIRIQPHAPGTKLTFEAI